MAGKRSSQARPSSPKNSIMKLAKSFGMINNLFLLRDGIDFSDCLPLEVARKGIGYLGTGVQQSPAGRPLHPLGGITRRWWSADRGRGMREMMGKANPGG